MPRVDVVIVGAGVAGLAAARDLARHGMTVRVLEARARLGGRILTRRAPGLALPIDLGAEFVHGDAPETLALLAKAAAPAVSVIGEHRLAHHGTLRRAPFFRKVDTVLRHIDPERPDESFAAFLERKPGGPRAAAARAAAREFVQGFHAADVTDIGVRALAPDPDERPSEGAAEALRVVAGQGVIVRTLARGVRGRVTTGAVVDAIAWRRSDVAVSYVRGGRRASLAARAAIVTLPIGVLQAPAGERGAVRLDPMPPRLAAALAGLAMGHATRVVMWFDALPWQSLAGRRGMPSLGHLGYLHARGEAFPVWWTPHPLRAPMLTGWCGGPPARAHAGQPAKAVIAEAIASLASALGRSRRHVAAGVRGAWLHDWTSDPFSRGAYSYARVGGAESGAALARPFDGTLFVAGEATDEGSGTVEGAIASGRRAARQVVRSLGRR